MTTWTVQDNQPGLQNLIGLQESANEDLLDRFEMNNIQEYMKDILDSWGIHHYHISLDTKDCRREVLRGEIKPEKVDNINVLAQFQLGNQTVKLRMYDDGEELPYFYDTLIESASDLLMAVNANGRFV